MKTAILTGAPIRSLLGAFAIASAGIVAAACGSSPTGTYFIAVEPIVDRHSRTMADAEAKMFEVTSLSVRDVFVFGEDAGVAARLLPIFRDTAVAVDNDISDWDAIDAPVVTGDYHALVREAMSLRLDAMRVSVTALEAVVAGNNADGSLSDAESLMTEANITLQKAREESDRIRG